MMLFGTGLLRGAHMRTWRSLAALRDPLLAVLHPGDG